MQQLKSYALSKTARQGLRSDFGAGMTSKMPAACPAKHLNKSLHLESENDIFTLADAFKFQNILAEWYNSVTEHLGQT